MSDVTTPSNAAEDAQFLAPETHQRAADVQDRDDLGLTATYSPEDNKLRLYAASRLDAETFQRVKAVGFAWAPKQGFFVAPMWTPAREDLLIALCGEIGDEDGSLVDRAQERAKRFEGYEDNRRADAAQARDAVGAIAQRFEFGQPILVGHHSERKARRDAERMQDGMRRAVQMWDRAEYWQARAAGALQHARYKERPDVRQRRIKKLEADKRKQERTRAEAQTWLKLWSTENLSHAQARAIAERCWLTVIAEGAGGSRWTAYDVLRPDGERYQQCPSWTVEQVVAVARRAYPKTIAWCDRWIAHYENRLAYERAMLAEQGGTPADKVGPEVGGGARCWASPAGGWSFIKKVNKVSVTVEDNWGNGGRNFTRTIPFDKLTQLMTAAQVQDARARSVLVESSDSTGFFLREPEPGTGEAAPAQPTHIETPAAQAPSVEGGRQDFEAMRQQLRDGVQVVSVPQLFPTPPELATRMAELLDPRDGHAVLEPSAGTGRLLQALQAYAESHALELQVTAVEIHSGLCENLRRSMGAEVVQGDFLACGEELGAFDRVVMNPPFENGADIRHILHAFRKLKPGGMLVGLCANGPRQAQTLRPLVDTYGGTWEELRPGSFAQEGTNVPVALLTLVA